MYIASVTASYASIVEKIRWGVGQSRKLMGVSSPSVAHQRSANADSCGPKWANDQ